MPQKQSIWSCQSSTACGLERLFKDKKAHIKWRHLHNSRCVLCKSSEVMTTCVSLQVSGNENPDYVNAVYKDDLSVEELFVAFQGLI